MTNELLNRKAEELICSCNDAVLTSVNADGYPRSCFISIIGHDTPWEIYFSTGTGGTKAMHFASNPKASVAYANIEKNNGVTLIGKAEIIDDISVKKKLWSEWMRNYFPGGPEDEYYCLIKFTAKEVTYWIDKEFGTVELDG